MSSTLAGFAPARIASALSASVPDARRLPTPALRVPLNDVGAWHEALVLQPIVQPRGAVSVRIESLLDTARHPGDAHVRYRGTLDRAALLRLRESIDSVLAQLPATPVTDRLTP